MSTASSSPSPNPILPSPPRPPHHHKNLSVAVGVAITALAGVAVAAAIYNRRSPFNRRKKKRRSLLTPKQWRHAFDSESGCLVNPHKILKKIRFGGIDPSIRPEVWLFLLGFYELDSTRKEREAEKTRKREVYLDLKAQCKTLRESSSEDSSEDSSASFVQAEEICSVKEEVTKREGIASSEEDSSEDVSGDDDCRENVASLQRDVVSAKLRVDKAGNIETTGEWMKAPEDFVTWQRIIRLDAVRMNAEWIPYSPSQANVTRKVAGELASDVGLKDDGHLEPCRQHHAARLVSILEAYALFDPEIGYCQGMSDLLSPFVALLDDDCEAFWCFVQFMNSARHNYRRDEAGIRRQLGKIANIFKAGDQGLHSHFERVQAQDCFFVYRMVVVLLRRELTFEQTISLWEVIWAEKRAVALGRTKSSVWKRRRKQLLTDDLILYVIVAAVRRRRKVILEKCKGLDEILRECNNMAGHLDVWTLLDDARELLSTIHGRVPE